MAMRPRSSPAPLAMLCCCRCLLVLLSNGSRRWQR
jgi:hypothetical protein